MNWRTIRIALLCLLILLNLVLGGYNVYLNRQQYMVSEERIEEIREQYRRKGWTLPEEIGTRQQYPMEQLELTQRDLESQADLFWEEAYEKSYMYGSKILYTCGTESIIIDRAEGSLEYTQNRPAYRYGETKETQQELAVSFAEALSGSEDLVLLEVEETSADTLCYRFCESYKDTLVFSNEVQIWIRHGVVVEASMTLYTVQGYGSDKTAIYPIDEVLYGCLGELGTAQAGETLDLYYGYYVVETEGETCLADPHVLLCTSEGTLVLADRYTLVFHDLA